MSDDIRISVVIPLYNKEHHIIETLRSVDQQKFPAYEVIVIDDGSTDRSVEKVQQQDFCKVRLIQKNNSGVSCARNAGIEHARGNYIAFLNAGDLWISQFLQEIWCMINCFPKAGLLATCYQCKESDNKFKDADICFIKPYTKFAIMKDYFAIASHGAQPFMMSSVVVKRADLKRLGGFPENELMGEDQELFSRFALYDKIAYSPRVMAIYQLDADNRDCINNVPERECPFSRRLQLIADNSALNQSLRSELLDYIAAHLLHLAKKNIRLGRLPQARLILNDKRCQRITVKHWLCEVRMLLAKIQRQLLPVPELAK
ncbi:MAG: glycosyltransferase [Pseudomonadales bacterium]|nr:glycosyltransferase [Pseudomonadales bacterium]